MCDGDILFWGVLQFRVALQLFTALGLPLSRIMLVEVKRVV